MSWQRSMILWLATVLCFGGQVRADVQPLQPVCEFALSRCDRELPVGGEAESAELAGVRFEMRAVAATTSKNSGNTDEQHMAKSCEDKPPATDADVRAAVSHSLPFLEREGVAWMRDRGCMSCHHVPFLLWSHRAAQSHGLTVDAQKLAEWDEWSRQDSLAHRNLYRLQNYDLGKVAVEKLPVAIKDKLKPLMEVPFKTEAEFLAKLPALLTEDELTMYRAIVLTTAERAINAPDRSGGGLDVLGQLLIGGQGTASELSKAEFRDGTMNLMQQLQQPDGSWKSGQQFLTMRRWSESLANQTTTMWAALALSADNEPGQKRSETIEKAIAFQRQQPPAPDNYEWLATRLLFEKQYGSMENVAPLRKQLLDVRGNDGGWGWEKGVSSDPFTTGLAIYVLAKVAGGDDAAVFRDARKYLLSVQHEDGSWPTPAKNFTKSTESERLKARDEIYHYWGTAWAAIGLLETLGKSDTVASSKAGFQ